MATPVPVVFATDDCFAPHCGASLASLIENCDPLRCYAVYILYDQLSQENLLLLTGMETKNVTVECINISQYIDKNLLYTHRRLSLATYYRFFVADVLPQYDKVVYLDSDIAILGDIADLYDTEIGANLLGGVVIFRGEPSEVKSKEEYLRELMGVSPDKYVNAGVLVMNLAAFRLLNIRDKCVDFIGKHRDLRWLDQDALNAVCKGQIYYLHENWNKSQFYYEDDLMEGRDVSNVKLIHYITNIKPWLSHFNVSHLHYYQYAGMSPYRDDLNDMFLRCNVGSRDERMSANRIKKETMRCAAHCDIGPRFFAKCLALWMTGKVKKMMNRKGA